MDNLRAKNLVGAFALAIADGIAEETAKASMRSPSDIAALTAIFASPGEPIDALARTLGLSQAGTSRLVERLVVAGLLDRSPGAKDGRYRGLSLTGEGEREARAVLDARYEAIGRGLSALSGEDRGRLLALIEPMLAALTPDRRTAEHSCRLCDVAACPQDDCPIELAARRTER